MKKLVTLIALALLLSAFAARAELKPEIKTFKTQTIMVYVIGADLEANQGLATADISEMLRAKMDVERLRVLVMTGGTNKWMTPLIPATKVSIFEIAGRNPKLVSEMESRSMGDKDTLSGFLDFTVENYPADSYGLVLWDHAGGPMVGFGVDILHRNDSLTLLELQGAFRQSRFGKDLRLEWIAFDACLMGSFEVASLMAEFADYMIASEETMPGRGFDYRFLSEVGTTGLTGPEVARAVIDRTFAYYQDKTLKNPQDDQPVTLSLLDLNRAKNAGQALDALFTNLDKGLEVGVYSDIARRRDATKTYGRTTTTNDYDLIDLLDLSGNMNALYPRESAALKEAVAKMVLYNKANVPRSGGVSLYFPLMNKTRFQDSWRMLYNSFGLVPAYNAFIDDFGEILLADSLSQWTGGDAPQVTYDEVTGEYFIQLTPEQVQNYERAQYYVLAKLFGEEYLYSFMSSDVTLDEKGRLRANFDGNTLYVTDLAGEKTTTPYMEEKENIQGQATYQIPVVLDRIDAAGKYESVGANLLVYIDKTTGEARIGGAIRTDDAANLMGKRDTLLSDWDNMHMIFSSFFLTRDGEGGMLPLGDWASSSEPRYATYPILNGLVARYQPIQPDLFEYFVMIAVSDTQGHVYASDLMPLNGREQAQAALPAREKPEIKTIHFPLGSEENALLLDRESVKITFKEVILSRGDETDSKASDVLSLMLFMENALKEPARVTADWLRINNLMVPSPQSFDIPAGSSINARLDIPVPAFGSFDGQLSERISRVEDIRFHFDLEYLHKGLFNYVPSDIYQILTGIDIDAGSLSQERHERSVLIQEAGITIELNGQPYVAEEMFYVPLRIINNSENFDLVKIVESSVNGFMGAFNMRGIVLPGSVLYTAATIPLSRQVLPPEFAEYQYMMDALDNLETMGVTEVRDISLRFQIDERAREGFIGRDKVSILTGAALIAIPGLEEYEQPLDTLGEEIMNSDGVRIIRLSSDPSGKRFYIKNDLPFTILLNTWGRIEVDGVNYGGNQPLYAVVSPGASAYITLFSYLPGFYPEGDEVSFEINVFNKDKNAFYKRTGLITISLR